MRVMVDSEKGRGHDRRHGASTARPVGLVAALAGLLVALLGAPTPVGSAPNTTAAPGPAALSLTVDPTTDLVDGDALAVTIDGFDPNRASTLRQCRAGATTAEDCSTRVITTNGVPGPLSGFFVVWALLDTPTGPVDCRTESCSIIFEQGDFASIVEVVTAFAPDGPVLQPTVVTSSTTGLANGDVVTITGSGFRPYDAVYIDQCVTGRDDSGCHPQSSIILELPIPGTVALAPTAEAAAAEAGVGFVQDQPVRATFETADFQPADCRPTGCELRIRQNEDGASFAFPLAFAEATGPVPTGPGPVPAAPVFTG